MWYICVFIVFFLFVKPVGCSLCIVCIHIVKPLVYVVYPCTVFILNVKPVVYVVYPCTVFILNVKPVAYVLYPCTVFILNVKPVVCGISVYGIYP